MLRSLYTGASGVKTHQTRMDVIGNNISNVNTTGYKTGRATFADVFSQNLKGATSGRGSLGGTNPLQIGLGNSVASIDVIHRDGSILNTGKNTDLALSGEGMFVVQRGNETYYTRDGAFELDAAGNYVLPGSGHFVQGWTATDGIIDPTGAVGNINVQLGKTMEAKATDNVGYHYNLDAEVPVITGLKGGETVSSTVLVEDVSETNPLPVKFGGKEFYVSGLSGNLDLTKNWTAKEDIPLGATTGDIVNEDGETLTVQFTPAATFECPKDTPMLGVSYLLTKGSVTAQYPLELYIDGKTYTAIGMDKNLDYSQNWTVKSEGAVEGSNTITVTNGENDITFTLDSPLTETLGQKLITIKKTSTMATDKNPVAVTYSDGSTRFVSEGVYKIGNSEAIHSSMKVYDNLGDIHEIPIYFTREGKVEDGVVSSANKWLVSLTPNDPVSKGDITTTEFIDAKGNKGTVSFNVAEIQFDSFGKLVTNGESNITTTMTLDFDPASFESDTANTDVNADTANPVAPAVQTSQNVTVDFSDLTQFAGNTTVSSDGNGNLDGILTKIEIDSFGVINGYYTNGVSQPEAQVALANFTNFPGLTKISTSLYQVSENSGAPVINEASNLGTVITSGALEMSNVDIANEFADMIITQRGFQSNTKIITVSDEMVETAVNMKR